MFFLEVMSRVVDVFLEVMRRVVDDSVCGFGKDDDGGGGGWFFGKMM